jgi:hypothetical protein
MSDPTGTDRPLWRDYSRYQVMVNFDIAKANGVLGMAARAGISYGYIDPFFATNYKGAGNVEMYRTSYHVLYPDQPVVKQADESWYKAHPAIDIIPRVIDLELDRSQPWTKIADQTWAMSELVLSRDGVRPIIYSRYLLINQWLQSWTSEMLNDHYWWLAQYSWFGYREHAGPPTLPKLVRRDRVILHQTSDHKLAPPGEVQSRAVDWDRWEIGNEQEMHTWISENWGGASPPPPPPPAPYIERVKVTASALNIRSEPSADAEDIGTLQAGTDVTITEKTGVWLKLKIGWIHGDYTEPV